MCQNETIAGRPFLEHSYWAVSISSNQEGQVFCAHGGGFPGGGGIPLILLSPPPRGRTPHPCGMARHGVCQQHQ